MKKLAFLFLLLPVLTTQSQQLLHPATPASAGMSAERLNRIDTTIQQYIRKGYVNGVTAMVIRDGKIIYNKAFGYDDISKKTPEKTDNIFRIASQTKAITSVAVMMLYEEGKFMLDDPISEYIPEFAHPKMLKQFNEKDTTYTTVPATREITIRDLLTHTSGLGYAQIGSKEANAIYAKAGVIAGIGINDALLADKMKILGGLPLMHNPGEKWTYGLNTDLLGYLIEVVSGKSLDQFLRERLFRPLGMNDTYFYLPENKKYRLVTLYAEDPKTHQIAPTAETMDVHGTSVYTDYPKRKGTYYSGGGGLSSTMYDYAVFLQMLLNGGVYNGVRILGRNTVRMMTMNQIGDLSAGWDTKDNFGLGFRVVNENSSNESPLPAGVFSWGGMFSTTYWADPKEKIIGLIYKNIWPTSYGDLNDKFKVLVYQAIND
ncbi:MAG TPA: serine hydrolase domain-containing protein [Chitinophaga sp.]|uniref:serine hydrolase domain-containing protein n=1 Tax=Chitinophaga sp. TaxID=1869181 RepID=UPI002B733937|nr:serine hydrolase domain-containing protein [Chitinophaga sp.]HVI46863.1 serine hydrolase domain-containing protein [Chitinophaga sp.]